MGGVIGFFASVLGFVGWIVLVNSFHSAGLPSFWSFLLGSAIAFVAAGAITIAFSRVFSKRGAKGNSEPNAEAVAPAKWTIQAADHRVLLQTSDVAEIRRGLLDGSIPPDAVCKPANGKEFLPIALSIARQEFQIGVLYYPFGSYVRAVSQVGGLVIAVLITGTLLFAMSAEVDRGGSLGPWMMCLVIGPQFMIAFLIGRLLATPVGVVVGLIRAPSHKAQKLNWRPA